MNVNDLVPVEFHEQRVLTTKQAAEMFAVAEEAIRKNFSRNKDRFTEGMHYFRLEGEDLETFLQVTNSHSQNSSKIRSLILWTKRGSARLAKLINTDFAWDVQDMLEENYFNPQNKPMSQLEILVESAKQLLEHEKKLNILKDSQKQLKSSQKLLENRVNRLETAQVDFSEAEYMKHQEELEPGYTASKVAEKLGYTVRKLNKILVDKKIQDKQNDGTYRLNSLYEGAGYVKYRKTPIDKGRKHQITLVWTEKGIEFLKGMLNK